MEYIRQIAQKLGQHAEERNGGEVIYHLNMLAEELVRLDPRDFDPDARYDFTHVRQEARIINTNVMRTGVVGSDMHLYRSLAIQVLNVLTKYGGEGVRAETRQFPYIIDAGLRVIVERDYKELSIKTMPSGAWKSSVIMAGSILEAILFDLLANDPARKAQALASAAAPRNRANTVLPLEGENWKLNKLIEVAAEIGLISTNRADTFDQTLRDYRNFVHPNKEIRAGHPCDEAEALMAKGALDGVCNILEQTLPAAPAAPAAPAP